MVDRTTFSGKIGGRRKDSLTTGLKECASAGALSASNLLLQGFPREELVAARALIARSAIVPKVAS